MTSNFLVLNSGGVICMGRTMYAIGGPALSVIKFRFWQKYAVGESNKFIIFIWYC